jgi:hypothetical protein
VDKAVVQLEYAARGLTGRLVLDGGTTAAEWAVIIRDQPQTYRYKVDWLLFDGSRLEGSWNTSSDRRLRLNAPASLHRAEELQVVSAGDFADVAQILVDLRCHGEPDSQSQLAFTKPGDSTTWEIKVAAGGDLEYEYRRTIVYQDGTTRVVDNDWVLERKPVLVVRDEFRYEIRLIPRLLDLGGTLSMVLVELESAAAGDSAPQRRTLVLKNKDEEPHWSFRLGQRDQHGYRYRLTPVTSQGDRRPATDWREADSEILVLTAPPA